MKKTGTKIQTYCNACLGAKRHTVLFSKDQHYVDEDAGNEQDDSEHTEYTLAECDGCDHITLLIDWAGHGHNNVIQYPPQTIRREPAWLIDILLDDGLNSYKYDFIQEIYVALRNNNLRLAVIGIRALIEQIMIEKVGDNKTFKANLDKFQSAGYISRVQREAIEPVIEAGHASVHRGFKASKEQVIYLMDVTENLIESIYVNQSKAEKINVPKRKT